MHSCKLLPCNNFHTKKMQPEASICRIHLPNSHLPKKTINVLNAQKMHSCKCLIINTRTLN
jgi:hypothetical protein